METWGLAGDSFILPSPWDLVTPVVTTTTTTTPPPIGPLGFSITTTTTTTTTSTTVATIVKTAPLLDDVKVTTLLYHHAQLECAASKNSLLNIFQSKYFMYISPFLSPWTQRWLPALL